MQIKAQDLTEEYDVASQRVTSNEDLAKQEDPVRDPRAWPGYSNMVEESSFYGKTAPANPKPLLAADVANRRANTAGPSKPTVSTPKAAKVSAPSPYNLSSGIRTTAQSSASGRVPWATKAATPVRIGREIEREAAAGHGYAARSAPPRELVEADELPLVKRKQSSRNLLMPASDRPPPPAFKTPFMTAPSATSTQRSKTLKRQLSGSCELSELLNPALTTKHPSSWSGRRAKRQRSWQATRRRYLCVPKKIVV